MKGPKSRRIVRDFIYKYDIFLNGQSWRNFQNLENKVLECFNYVALDEPHEHVWSNNFGELLIRIGSAIDSFFHKARECYRFDNEVGIQKLRKNKEPHIGHYREFFEPYYKLSGAGVSITFNGVFYKTYFPFAKFNSNQKPNWFNAYNKVKHEWYDCLEEHGTFINIVEALGGLFILNALHKDSQKWLNEKGFIIGYINKERRYKTGFTKEYRWSFLGRSKFGIKWKTEGREEFYISSQLFEHILRIDELIDEF